MKILSVYYSRRFKKSLEAHRSSKEAIKNKIELFVKDPFNPQLKTHKLTGKLAGFWSFSVSFHLRVLFEFIDPGTAGFVDIGTHEIYH
ncbi:MAG: type II toxin-antitoxin system mRNA interferase toxin, RelE/StbE family [Patescibacteria group bacterium]